MARPERLQQQRTPLGVALLLYLYLAIFSTAALASTPASHDEGWAEHLIVSVATVPVAFAAMDETSMPVAMDAMPCALCYSAPAPSPHGVGGECREHEAMAWPVHVSPAPAVTYFDPGGRHVRLPVRILYCRWLD
ncbi:MULTISPECIES: hypothetical protein [unclassified Variovorax]|uniref:hypothetical protein n=1 Tax=unclassified Variovorax TaxID=663243 RepID=UPI000F7ECB6D|nr:MULTISPECIES: hypothetical protein [unclassified Variovorax]RSZ44105.1 hypothetical protein EJO70_09250 [Variovorax sp. 553]RSZ45240.1 hypothetical protein EJO71_08590 [Variovorax sp. 679]